MKRFVIVLAFVSLVPAMSLAAGPIKFGVHGNYATIDLGSANFAGTLKDAYGGGWGGGLHLDIDAVIREVRVSGDYMSFSPDNDKYRQAVASVIPGTTPSQFTVEGGKVSIWTLAGNVKMPFPLPVVSPYITGGLGLGSINADEAKVLSNGTPLWNVPEVSTGTKFLLNLGAGVDLNLMAVELFLEAKYTWILTEGEESTYIPITLGVTF